MIRAVRQFFWAELAVFAIAIGVMLALINCAHVPSKAEQAAAEATAEAAYGAALLDCVAKSDTRDQADSCTDTVNARYGRAPDGGAL